MKPRIKICGLTRTEDVIAAVAAGADAIGLVFYEKSPRYVTAQLAHDLAQLIPPFVTLTGLFVNADPADVEQILSRVPLNLLQFHGDENEAYCRQFNRPYLKALRVQPGMDLLQCAALFPSAQAVLLDAFCAAYGGSGKVFDWQLIPPSLGKPMVLSGGLNADNVAQAIARVHPDALDVSSGVEIAKGIKDAQKMRCFVAAVNNACAS